MLPELTKIKGIHPGLILKRELNRQGIKPSDLAKSIDEHKQNISAILHEKRKVNPRLSIKLSEIFNVEDDYFMSLQSSYDVKQIHKSKSSLKPSLNKFRDVLFWDTSIENINWQKQKKAIIKRVLERGNKEEIEELIDFYGKKNISKEIKTMQNSHLHSFEKNLKLYDLG